MKMNSKYQGMTIKAQIEELTQDLQFSNCAEDFVTYEEMQRAAIGLGMTCPTRQQIDAHMKIFFKMLPEKRNQREGFSNVVLDVTALREARDRMKYGKLSEDNEFCVKEQEELSDTNAKNKNLKRKAAPTNLSLALTTKMSKFKACNVGQPDGLSAKLIKDAADKEQSKILQKKIIKLSTLLDVPDNFDNQFVEEDNALSLVVIQAQFIDILQRRVQTLDDILQRNLL